jgi:hypothetical protein
VVQGRNLGRAGALERDNATIGSVKTLGCRFGSDPQGSEPEEKHVSGTGGDGRPVDPDGEYPREDENQEGNGF